LGKHFSEASLCFLGGILELALCTAGTQFITGETADTLLEFTTTFEDDLVFLGEDDTTLFFKDLLLTTGKATTTSVEELCMATISGDPRGLTPSGK